MSRLSLNQSRAVAARVKSVRQQEKRKSLLSLLRSILESVGDRLAQFTFDNQLTQFAKRLQAGKHEKQTFSSRKKKLSYAARFESLEGRAMMAVDLTAGDIAFTGVQTDAPDSFSFVLLKDVDSSTTLTFTDNGWKATQNGRLTSENTATVTFGSNYIAGTHFAIVNGGTPAFRLAGTTTSAGSIVSALSGLSSSGDSILAYQGTAPTTGSATNWIAGINSQLSWYTNTLADPSSNDSALPTALTNGVNAILFNSVAETDQGWLNLSSVTGNVATIRSTVNNVANWTRSDTSIINVPPTTTFTVTGINTNPTITANSATYAEGAAATTIGIDKLSVTDVDNTAAQIVYALTVVPAGGTLAKNGVALVASDTFTQTDIDSNLITYAHGGGESASDSFAFTVSDGAGGSIASTNFAITVTPVNDAPVISVNRTLVLNPSQSVTISAAILSTTDPDTVAASLVYTVATGPTRGTLTKNAVAITTFTQADLIASDTLPNSIRYTATTAIAGDSDTIVVSVSDGTSIVSNVTLNVSIIAATTASFTGSYSQNFDGLLPTPVPGNNLSMPAAQVLPQGWSVSETGTNSNSSVRVDNGSQATGDTFLYGATDSNERALGSQGSGSLITARVGVALTNTTGTTITSLNVAYVGEL